MIPFPDFDEEILPLVLIKEWECIVIFNVKEKTYLKIRDIDTTGECSDSGISSK